MQPPRFQAFLPALALVMTATLLAACGVKGDLQSPPRAAGRSEVRQIDTLAGTSEIDGDDEPDRIASADDNVRSAAAPAAPSGKDKKNAAKKGSSSAPSARKVFVERSQVKGDRKIYDNIPRIPPREWEEKKGDYQSKRGSRTLSTEPQRGRDTDKPFILDWLL